MEIARSRVDHSARRLSNRSMLTGSNAKILENRFSSLRNSPSGNLIVHPKSRIPDNHPTDLIELKKMLNRK